MILDESFVSIIKQEPRSNAAKEAKKLGLRYAGFGRYLDRKGEVAYIVDRKQDRLIPYDRGEQTEKEFKRQGILGSKLETTKDPKKRESIHKEYETAGKNIDSFVKSREVYGDDVQKSLRAIKKESEKTIAALKKFYRKEIFTENEWEALQIYAGDGFIDINQFLYKGNEPGQKNTSFQPRGTFGGSKNKLHSTIMDLDSAFDETETPIDVTCYSGLSYRISPNNLTKGKKFIFQGFLSTSLDINEAIFFSGEYENQVKQVKKNQPSVILQIDVSAGSKGIYLDTSESEFILPRGSVIEVIDGPHIMDGLDYDDDSKLAIFHCKVVPSKEE